MSEMLIKKAINNKQKISFNYNGKNRIVDPQILGISKGNLQLLTWQTGGQSSSGNLPDWRRFDVPLMYNVVILEQTFLPQPKGDRDAYFDVVILIVK